MAPLVIGRKIKGNQFSFDSSDEDDLSMAEEFPTTKASFQLPMVLLKVSIYFNSREH
jgi:hypothetical protein